MEDTKGDKGLSSVDADCDNDKASEENKNISQVSDEKHHSEEEIQDSNESSNSDDSDFDDFTCKVCNKMFSGFKPLEQHLKSGKHHKAVLKKKSEKKLRTKLEHDLPESSEDLSLAAELYEVCDACKKEFYGPESFQQHLNSKTHQKKVKEANLLHQVMEDGKINIEKMKKICKPKATSRNAMPEEGAVGFSPFLDDSDDSDTAISADSQQFECSECQKVFTGFNPWSQHLISKTHKKAIKKKNLQAKLLSSSPQNSNESGISSAATDLGAIELHENVLTCKVCHKSFSGPESASDHSKSKGHTKKLEFHEWKMARSRSPISADLNSSEARDEMSSKEETTEGSTLNTACEEETQGDQSALIATNLIENAEPANVSGSNDLCETSQHADITLAVETVDGKSVPNSKEEEIRNTLLSYETYKEYKRIMNEIHPENI